MLAELAAALRDEASTANERRLLVLAGAHRRTLDAAESALDAAEIPRSDTIHVGDTGDLGCERVPMDRVADLLGTTHTALVFDAHEGLRPTAIGRVIGAVDGGGLLLLCCPPLEDWPDGRDPADERFAVPPFDVADVTGCFRARFVDTLYEHEGVAVVDVDAMEIRSEGLTDPEPHPGNRRPAVPTDATFPAAAYKACLTGDQAAALVALEELTQPEQAVVIESDRGRGKSSVAGLAAGCLALNGADVAVTAPQYRSAKEGFLRADTLLADTGATVTRDTEQDPHRLRIGEGGEIRYAPAADLDEIEADVLIVDEAAGLGVPRLEAALATDRVAFVTTVHGYEGAGRSFSVRFRDALATSRHSVTEIELEEPIRYAPGDPVEIWAFRALLLDARPAVDAAVGDADVPSADYAYLSPDELIDNETRLREAFGLLVLAHYQTEPDDLARLLDAPNIQVRALLYNDRVVSIALLAREGGLPSSLRQEMYEGGRVRGHMLPDVLTSQLRDEGAGDAVGWRVLRIATHPAVRNRGLGSRLLDGIHDELAEEVDWFGTGYGATPELLSFWAQAGYGTIHLSTTRNEESGEHSAIMLRPASEAGASLARRHGSWFARRVVNQLPDALRELDPDVVRAALRSVDVRMDPDLRERDWRLIAGMAYGPGLLDVDPGPFRQLAAAHLIDPTDRGLLTVETERLLVRRVLQAGSWERVATELGYASRAGCMRATGTAYRRLLDAYGPDAAIEEAERYR